MKSHRRNIGMRFPHPRDALLAAWSVSYAKSLYANTNTNVENTAVSPVTRVRSLSLSARF